MLDKYRPLVPGLALAVGVALVAQVFEVAQRALLGRPYFESIVLALLLGVALRNAPLNLTPFEKGAVYASKQVLELAVVLLGAGIMCGPCSGTCFLLVALFRAVLRSQSDLIAENLLLRQQIAALTRPTRRRPRLRTRDKLFWIVAR